MSLKFEPFGNYFAGDGLSNIPVGERWGTQVAFRFIANDTVPVNRLRFFNAWSIEKPGYHEGTGGKLAISLRTAPAPNGGSTHPYSNDFLLANTIVDQPAGRSKQLLVSFGQTAILRKGVCHLITFENVDRAAARNWVSVNTMALFSVSQTPPFIHGLGVLARWAGNKIWQEQRGRLPIFTLFYSLSKQIPDQIAVPGYGGMESWVSEPRRIAGDEMVRQVFRPLQEITVHNVAIRIAKEGTPGPLTARLWQDRTEFAEGQIEAAAVKPINTMILPPNRLGHDWVIIPFPKPVTLTAGLEYRLSLQAPAGDAYEVFPLRDGAEFGYCSPWPNAWAEFTTDGDRGWQAWKAWGKSSYQGDLQLYFNA